MNINDIITESHQACPHCGGPLVEYSGLMEKKDACYYKVKASAKVWPSAYASGRLVQCRKKGAANYGNKSEGVVEGLDDTVRFEVDSENAYNHVMDQFGSVIDWDGDTMVAPRKYWGAIQELAYAANGEASEEHGLAEGSAADGSVNYTLGHTPDAEYVYSIYRDGKKEGTYHSVDQAREIMGNMKLTSPNREYKIKRGARNKMAGPASQLPEQGIAEAHNFKGSFPFDVDHMGGTRGINLPSAPTKKFFTDKKQWSQTVDDINSSKYDDNSEYSGTTGRTTVSIDNREWARWSDAQEKGYIEMSSMTEQDISEDDDAVAAFLARGGEIQQLKPQSGPKRSGVAFASKHIGSAGGRGNTKGKVSGLGANTGKASKPVVTAEQHMAESSLNEARDARIKRIQELSEGLSVDDLAKVPMFVVDSFKKAAFATGQEAIETKNAIKTVFNWSQSSPEQKQAAKKQLHDIAKIAASLAIAGAVGHAGAAALGVGHAATAVGAVAKTAIEHIIADIGIEAVASILGAGGINIVKNALHDITTSSGHEFEKQQYQQGVKQRIKTQPMAGPTGQLPEQTVAEDALAGMKRLAGIAPAQTQTTPGQRQYRHMPTAVQPR
jgi:hypothetical protein